MGNEKTFKIERITPITGLPYIPVGVNNVYDNILDTIGHAPLIKINKAATDNGVFAQVWAKVEYFNPGMSIKDKIALKMIENAETRGQLKPGGTIIEGTSGNTGMALAIVGLVKGYRCILTAPAKISPEKLDNLRALGVEVIVCPTNVPSDDPKSYYSVAEKLSKEIPNSFYVNQYFNKGNALAHYETTGPEIWKQTNERITHLVVGVGTGGTISGTAKYLKEQNEDIQVIGVDAYGSVLKKYHETRHFDANEIYPYLTEGVGKNIIPSNVDFDLIDRFVKVKDKDGALMARALARHEGMFIGYSCGAAMQGVVEIKEQLTPNDVVVVIFPDHGSRYVGKIYNDEWMKKQGFL